MHLQPQRHPAVSLPAGERRQEAEGPADQAKPGGFEQMLVEMLVETVIKLLIEMLVEMDWISDDTRKVIESALSMFVPHFSTESTAKGCKLHKIVASQGAINISQGAINIDNLVKFSTYSLLSDDLTVLESVEQGEVFTEGESFSAAKMLLYRPEHPNPDSAAVASETLSPVLSSEQIFVPGC